jgi:hypothetical protein
MLLARMRSRAAVWHRSLTRLAAISPLPNLLFTLSTCDSCPGMDAAPDAGVLCYPRAAPTAPPEALLRYPVRCSADRYEPAAKQSRSRLAFSQRALLVRLSVGLPHPLLAAGALYPRLSRSLPLLSPCLACAASFSAVELALVDSLRDAKTLTGLAEAGGVAQLFRSSMRADGLAQKAAPSSKKALGDLAQLLEKKTGSAELHIRWPMMPIPSWVKSPINLKLRDRPELVASQRVVVVSGAGSWLPYYADPLYAGMWVALVEGTALFVYGPPESSAAAKTAYGKSSNRQWHRIKSARAQELVNWNGGAVLVRAGEILWLPPGWWYAQFSLTFCIKMVDSVLHAAWFGCCEAAVSRAGSTAPAVAGASASGASGSASAKSTAADADAAFARRSLLRDTDLGYIRQSLSAEKTTVPGLNFAYGMTLSEKEPDPFLHAGASGDASAAASLMALGTVISGLAGSSSSSSSASASAGMTAALGLAAGASLFALGSAAALSSSALASSSASASALAPVAASGLIAGSPAGVQSVVSPAATGPASAAPVAGPVAAPSVTPAPASPPPVQLATQSASPGTSPSRRSKRRRVSA